MKKFLYIILILIICAAVFVAVKPASKPESVNNEGYLSYPHNTSSFTEGLFFYNGQLYESMGPYEKSAVYKNIDINSGVPEASYRFEDDIFAEGSVVFYNKLYVLTYKENKAFIFDPDTLELLDTLNYPRDGWGLTTDGEYLIASDGSSSLFYLDEELQLIKTLDIFYNGEPIDNINELEYINGLIWANIWRQDFIVIIDPATGNVLEVIDFGDILPVNLFEDDANDVLNGIAYDPAEDRVYITGKYWPLMFSFARSSLYDN